MPVEFRERPELPGRFEFGSAAWLEEMRGYLAARLGTRTKSFFRDDLPPQRLELGPTPFTLSECHTGAPAHLGLEGDEVRVTIAWDGHELSVAPRFDPDADLVVHGDYHAALFLAQSIGLVDPARRDTADALMRHAFGDDAIRIAGELPNPAAGPLLAQLHDHLGRRTVDDPDLAHRARRLDVERHIREMETLGYTIVEKVLPDSFTDPLRAEVLRLVSTTPGPSLSGLLQHGTAFEFLAWHPAIMALVDATLGRGALMGYYVCSRRGPGKGFIPLHTDYDHIPEPFPEWAVSTNCLFALDDWNDAACGPTWVVPGSHRMRRTPRRDDDTSGGIPITMPKGSVLVMTHGVWHWQGDRSDPGERVTINAHYFRGAMRTHDSLTCDEKLLYRSPPRVGEMLGLDDWFGKAGLAGKDLSRLAYMMGLNRFTDECRARILEAEA